METKGKRGVEPHRTLGPYPHQKKAAIPFCQLPPLPCHRLSAQDRHRCASYTWVRTDKNQFICHLKTNHHQTSVLWPVLSKPGSYMMPGLTLPLGTGLAGNLECIGLFRSTRGSWYCCIIRLRMDCFQKTTVCYCC